jgi:hypothetical protein
MARSIYRPTDYDRPYIYAQWATGGPRHFFYDSHLNDIMFKLYDHSHVISHLLPTTALSYRYEPAQQVSGCTLSHLIEALIEEIMRLSKNARPKEFKHFRILKMRDVDWYDHTGVYIVEFKEYPFVVKLFIETPSSFINPCAKSFEAHCFYYMGGVTRHTNGFTRIKNLNTIAALVKQDPYWSERVDFPRKWFWLPENPQWIHVEGFNIGPEKRICTHIPAIYAVVCDKIVWSRPFSLSSARDRRIAMELSTFVDMCIDPHINNFGYEEVSGKIVPIDFEHFKTGVGLRSRWNCSGYFEWYTKLSCKMLDDLFLRNKQARRKAQYMCYSVP